MAKQKKAVCPGCSRHCTQDCVRCKYGRRYFEKTSAKETEKKNEPKERRRKWERYVQKGSLLWKLLFAGMQCKHALKKKGLTEQMILRTLNEEEQSQLNALLDKIICGQNALQDAYETPDHRVR